jgi:hypothetical protein
LILLTKVIVAIYIYLYIKYYTSNSLIHLIGYLTYDEFRAAIKTLNTPLSEDQITQVIEAVDLEKDGYIELSELLEVNMNIVIE